MFEAHETYFAEHSGNHGHATWLTQTGDPEILADVKDTLDIADAALAEYDEKQANKKNAQKGLSRFVVLVTPEGDPVPTGGIVREAGLKAQAALLNPELGLTDDDDDLARRRRPAQGYNPADYGDGIVDSG